MTVIISRGACGLASWTLFLVACVWNAGCSKHDSASAPASASAAARAPEPEPEQGGESADRWGAEAKRGRLEPASDPRVAQARGLVSAHFGGKLPAELSYQSVSLEHGAVALLLDGKTAASGPLLLALGPHHKVLWTRKRPLAGIVPGTHAVTLSRGPRGDVALFWFNEPSATVATRMWDVEGGLLMDAQVMETDSCEALSVFFWPHRGWVVVAARQSSLLVQLLGENGDRDFGARGRTIATRWRAAAPVSIVADTPDSVMLFHLGYLALSPNPTSGDHLFAHRYDAHGVPLWRGPLDAGRLPARVHDESVRVAVRHTAPGRVLASLPAQVAGGHFEVEVRSTGTADLR